MFDKIKQIHQLKKLQDDFKKERLVVEKNGVFVTMNGSFEVEEIKLNSALGIEDQQNALKQALNEARESIQKTLAQKMMASGMGF
ncbi:MAG: YbaB/EbfC family nucleoid-associated protein [bacterium]|nr:YbaB/EbfC family nucleoid-associated protein [bacterium]